MIKKRSELMIKSYINKYLKKVAFAKTVQVVLIPTIQEYKDINIAKDLWLNDYEYSNILKDYHDIYNNCNKDEYFHIIDD